MNLTRKAKQQFCKLFGHDLKPYADDTTNNITISVCQRCGAVTFDRAQS